MIEREAGEAPSSFRRQILIECERIKKKIQQQ